MFLLQKLQKRMLLIFLCSTSFLLSEINSNDSALEYFDAITKHYFTPEITSLNVSDWSNPTVDDYKMIQQFLRKKVAALCEVPMSDRPFPLEHLNGDFYGWSMYKFNRAGMGLVPYDATELLPNRHVIYFNNNPDDKTNCVICYVNYPRSATDDAEREYIYSLGFIIESLKKFNFDGHLIYYIGGWPGLEKGRLKFVDVPFGFKPFLFEEAKDLGYKNILWLDSCSVPVKSLKPVFDFIEKEGLCYHVMGKNDWAPIYDGYPYIMPFLNITKSNDYDWVSTQIIGFNMANHKGVDFFNKWLEAAEKKTPYLLSDEPAFTFLVNISDVKNGRLPRGVHFEGGWGVKDFSYWTKCPEAIIYHNYDFLNPDYNKNVPEELFNH